jgi:gamma-glutamylcyclotransferase (GGCT)/AIG2-like uncharacterized protein YtfP
MLIFVYGTLKDGHGNNRILQTGKAAKIAEDVVEGYELFYSGFPVARANPDTAIRGEVWDIGDPEKDAIAKNTQIRLDALEGTPYMYTREVVNTRGGRSVSMYVGTETCFQFNRMKNCHVDGTEHYWGDQ